MEANLMLDVTSHRCLIEEAHGQGVWTAVWILPAITDQYLQLIPLRRWHDHNFLAQRD